MANTEPKTNGAPSQQEAVLAPLPKLNLLQKLASVVAEIDNVDKRGRNTFQNYNYVKAADVAWLVRKALASRNIYLVTDVVEIRNYLIPAKEGHLQAIDLRMEFSFFDGDSPETPPIVLHSWGTGTDKGDKAVYKAMTGALKYGLRHAFLIPDESDPEGDSSVDKATQKAAIERADKANTEHTEKMAVIEAKNRQKDAQGGSQAQPALFYTVPESHHGHFAEFVNIPAFLSSRQDLEDGLRMVFTAHMAKKTKDGTALVPSSKLPALLEKLAGEMGITVKLLESR